MRSKKFTALTVKAIADKPNKIVKKVLKFQIYNLDKFCFEAFKYLYIINSSIK